MLRVGKCTNIVVLVCFEDSTAVLRETKSVLVTTNDQALDKTEKEKKTKS